MYYRSASYRHITTERKAHTRTTASTTASVHYMYSFYVYSEPIGVSTAHALQVERHYRHHITTETMLLTTTDSQLLQQCHSHRPALQRPLQFLRVFRAARSQHGTCTTGPSDTTDIHYRVYTPHYRLTAATAITATPGSPFQTLTFPDLFSEIGNSHPFRIPF